MRRFLSVFAVMLACLAPQAEAVYTPLPDLSKSFASQAYAPEPDYIIETVQPLGQSHDGSHLDLVVLVAPETHTRAICVVQSPLGLDYVSVSDGNVYWNVEKDSYLYNPDVNQFLIGTVADGKVSFNENFGGGSASLKSLKKYASRFWDRPVSGSVMDPSDISSMQGDVQSGIVEDYLQHYVRDYGYAVLQEDRGMFSNKRTRRLDQIQTGLDVAGMTPAYGIIADVPNTVLYGLRGKWGDFVLGLGACIPAAGQYATATKLAKRTGNALDTTGDLLRLADDVPAGGRFFNVRRATIGGQVHHMPAASVSSLPYNRGPAIWMETADHARTASFGRSRKAMRFRAQQQRLIEQGLFDDAIIMDIDDIQNLFGNKYDDAILQMIDTLD